MRAALAFLAGLALGAVITFFAIQHGNRAARAGFDSLYLSLSADGGSDLQ